MTSFVYDVINPCDFTGFPAKYGLILNSKNGYPPTSILQIRESMGGVRSYN